MRKVLSGYMFEKDYREQTIPIEDFFQLAHDKGFDGVDLRKTQLSLDSPPLIREKIKQLSRQTGLGIGMMTLRDINYRDAEGPGQFKKYLALLQALKCSLLKVGSDSPDVLKIMAKTAAEKGVTIATNNHSFSVTETCKGAVDLMERVNMPNYGLLYDPCHLYLMDSDDYKGHIERFLPWMKAVICQNAFKVEKTTEATVKARNGLFKFSRNIEEGELNWPEILRILRDKGFKGPVILFYHDVIVKDTVSIIDEFCSWF